MEIVFISEVSVDVIIIIIIIIIFFNFFFKFNTLGSKDPKG